MGTGKFHINQADGTVGACRAEKGNCPFGGEDQHYTSIVAAATAYEDSMADQLFAAPTKAKKIAKDELFDLAFPDYYIVEDHLTGEEAAEAKALGKPGEDVYKLMRSEVGPALIHSDANNVMYYWKQNYDQPGGRERWNQAVKRVEPGETYELVKDYIENGNVKLYGSIPSAEEVHTSLIDNAKKAISATRNYGMAEDEMTRHYQDKRERAYIKALNLLSGEGEDRVRQKLLSDLPVNRPHQGVSDEGLDHKIGILERRIATLKNRQTKQIRSRELGELQREVSIRKIQAASHDDAWKVAAEVNGVSQRDAIGILGVPNSTDLRHMDDATKEFWTK